MRSNVCGLGKGTLLRIGYDLHDLLLHRMICAKTLELYTYYACSLHDDGPGDVHMPNLYVDRAVERYSW